MCYFDMFKYCNMIAVVAIVISLYNYSIIIYIHYTHKYLWSINSVPDTATQQGYSSKQACALTELTFSRERNSICKECTIFPQDPQRTGS